MQGLQKNKYQFALLVLVNAFVGAMVGLERYIIPDFGKSVFGINGHTALLSFIIAFGISKALSNYAVAFISKKLNRQKILILPFRHWHISGIAQLFTGKMGDIFCKKQLISMGMLLQALAIVFLVLSNALSFSVISSILLGLGTALVYPNFLSVVAENSHPTQRAATLSIFRFWRDSGYVAGAILSGLLADYFGIPSSLIAVAALTALAGMYANTRMCCTKKLFWRTNSCGSSNEKSIPINC